MYSLAGMPEFVPPYANRSRVVADHETSFTASTRQLASILTDEKCKSQLNTVHVDTETCGEANDAAVESCCRPFILCRQANWRDVWLNSRKCAGTFVRRTPVPSGSLSICFSMAQNNIEGIGIAMCWRLRRSPRST